MIIKCSGSSNIRIKNPAILAIGSSITLYGVHSGPIVAKLGSSYYNFGAWNLQIGDMRMILETLLKDYRPNYVVICSSIGDFYKACDTTYF